MAVVYRAFDRKTKRDVAIKIPLIKSDDMYERARREYQALDSLDHWNIVAGVDHVESVDGKPCVVMEYHEGRTLADHLRHTDELPSIGSIISVAKELALALDHIHDAGLIHRDIKPDNVILVGDLAEMEYVRPVLCDFGLAHREGDTRLENAGNVVGTPLYLAPESAELTQYSDKSDLYSLGVIMYEMLTGGVPHRASNPKRVMEKVIDEPVVLPRECTDRWIPEDLEELVMSLLAKDPQDRPFDALSVLLDLDLIDVSGG